MDIRIPEGANFDQGVLNQAKAIMADAKTTSQQKLQSIVELQHQFQTKASQDIVAKMQQNRVSDLEALKGDPKYGGAMYDRTLAASRSILEKSQHGAAVSRKLVAYGLDCDPDFTKLFAEFSGLIAEDGTGRRLVNNPPPAPTAKPRTQTERMAVRYTKKPQSNNAPK